MLSNRPLHSRILEASVGFGTVLLVSFLTFHFLKKPKKKHFSLENMMEVLRNEKVHMKDPGHVKKILSQMINEGPSKLQVISDFDHTISRVHKDGIKCATTYGILQQAPFLTEDYRKKSSGLFSYYHPIEIDPNLTKAQKTPYMIEWYTKSFNLMPTSGILKEQIPLMVESSNVCLREGCETVFHSLDKHNVPLLIFSAGIGDILEEVLKQQNLLLPNMKIIANFMHFNEKEMLTGFSGDLIHTFNKNQSSIENSDYFETLKSRSNVILLGDSLGDLDMSEGAQNMEAILRIGFLNYKIEDSLLDYLNAYDIVLTDDQTMDVVNGLLENILC
jgi:HAD superfamily hydrolase (TIGR01544 family)